jgi:hypothetical protein
VPNENFRRELGQTFDDMTGSPSAALRDRVRSSVANAPERRGPFWIAGLAAAMIAALVVGLLVMSNLNRNLNGLLPATPPSASPSAQASPSASPSAQASPSTSVSPTPGSSLPAFVCASSTTITGQNAPLSAYINDVRTGTHAGYDRLTIQFSNGQPGSIVLTPQNSATFNSGGGRGGTVTLAGQAGILVNISIADAHTSYSGSTDIKTSYPVMVEVRQIEDYEGYVQWAVGLSKPACYRAFILTNPTRLVIDVQTP